MDRESLRHAGKYPQNKTDAVETEAQLDLLQRTYELLSMVREPSAEEKKILIRRGFVFLGIEAKTLAQVVGEHPGHFSRNNSQDVVNLLTYVPMTMEVAFNPKQLYIPVSFGKTQEMQLRMTGEYSQTNLEKELQGAKALMLPVTVYAQADIAYFQKTGEGLFRDHFANFLDRPTGSGVIGVGRSRPGLPLVISSWLGDYGFSGVKAPLAVVFIQQ